LFPGAEKERFSNWGGRVKTGGMEKKGAIVKKERASGSKNWDFTGKNRSTLLGGDFSFGGGTESREQDGMRQETENIKAGS